MITASTLALLSILLSFFGKLIAGVVPILVLLSSAIGNSNLFNFYRRGRPSDETEDTTIDSLLRRLQIPDRFLSRASFTFRYVGLFLSVVPLYAAYKQYVDPNTWTPFRLYGEDASQNVPTSPKSVARDYLTSADFAPKLVAKDTNDSVRLALELNPTADGVRYLGDYPNIIYSFDNGSWRSMFDGFSASPIEIDERQALSAKKIYFKFVVRGSVFGPFEYPINSSQVLLSSFQEHLNKNNDWFSCSNGECYARSIARYLPAVAAIRIGTSPAYLERYVRVPSFASDELWGFSFTPKLPNIYVLPNVDSFMQLVYVDGTSSHVIQFRDQSSESNLRGVLVSPTPDISSNPRLLAAHDSNYQKWYLMPVQDEGKIVNGYSIGNGAFKKVEIFSLGFWGNKALVLNDNLSNSFVRFQYIDADTPQVRTEVSYIIHGSTEATYGMASLTKDGSKLVECLRFVESDFIHEGKSSPSDIDAQGKINFSRQTSGYGFVHQPGVACIIPEISMSGTLTQADVSAITSVIFRAEPGRVLQESSVVQTDGNINNESVEYKRNYSHTYPVLPAQTAEIFVRYRLKTGNFTDEFSVKIGSYPR